MSQITSSLLTPRISLKFVHSWARLSAISRSKPRRTCLSTRRPYTANNPMKCIRNRKERWTSTTNLCCLRKRCGEQAPPLRLHLPRRRPPPLVALLRIRDALLPRYLPELRTLRWIHCARIQRTSPNCRPCTRPTIRTFRSESLSSSIHFPRLPCLPESRTPAPGKLNGCMVEFRTRTQCSNPIPPCRRGCTTLTMLLTTVTLPSSGEASVTSMAPSGHTFSGHLFPLVIILDTYSSNTLTTLSILIIIPSHRIPLHSFPFSNLHIFTRIISN
ncbi:hypothetical protein L227DRAFT_248323 [Lentinus tigrinus ALCF2SS1-6]|uniref:Uncharacterized protein n=1 Tax=Lentinus tigrinus ALCF2SS1-6 TaxID=1328759 RepID=A0A5C2S032_9APHY|nr:hypothetical protein L227DRAFT_248323 [Lentinus tigrinus ALCF2SS1-6]